MPKSSIHINLKRIILPHGMVREIAKMLEISERTVYSAAKGTIKGRKSVAARKLAELKLEELEQE